MIPGPNRQIPIWIGGFSPAAFRRAVDLGDGFMFAGTEDKVYDALGLLREQAAASGRSLDGYGLDYVALRTSSAQDSIDQAERWREAGGTHFSAVSMGKGFDTIDAHVEFYDEIAVGLLAG